MITYQTVERKVPRTVICDICKIEYDCDKECYEAQEFVHINSKCGYGSVFGDGVTVKLDLCQACFKGRLGDHIVVVVDCMDGEEDECQEDR